MNLQQIFLCLRYTIEREFKLLYSWTDISCNYCSYTFLTFYNKYTVQFGIDNNTIYLKLEITNYNSEELISDIRIDGQAVYEFVPELRKFIEHYNKEVSVMNLLTQEDEL